MLEKCQYLYLPEKEPQMLAFAHLAFFEQAGIPVPLRPRPYVGRRTDGRRRSSSAPRILVLGAAAFFSPPLRAFFSSFPAKSLISSRNSCDPFVTPKPLPEAPWGIQPGGVGMMGPSGRLWVDVANWSTILVCLVLKVPQGAALLRARSARGISLESLVLELCGFVVCLRYMSYYNYSLPTYVEYPIIIVQDVILLLFILHYSGKMKHALPYTVIFVAGWYILSLQKWILDLAMNLSTVVSAASKLAQLRCLWQTKDSGQVSATTWGLATYTCATRIFTTLMTTKDATVLVRFITMMILNLWVIATVLHYRKTAKKTD
uniref:Solute carrier family 66 member 3 n=1 Tax=Salvator merianae TaxID=96440 RepID=A0A8D0BMW0_SALMN